MTGFSLLLCGYITTEAPAINKDYSVTLKWISHTESGCGEVGSEEYTAIIVVDDDAGPTMESGCFTADIDGDSFVAYNQVIVVRTNIDANFITFGMRAWEDDDAPRCSINSGDDCVLNDASILETNFFGAQPGFVQTFSGIGNGRHSYAVDFVWTYTTPSVPQNVTASRQAGPGVLVDWSAADNADEYFVYRAYLNSFNIATYLGSTMGTDWLDTTVSWGNYTSAYYWVVAGNPSDVSSESAVAQADIRLDYGDAFNGYPVRFADNGARHVPVGPRLGTRVDGEADAPNNGSRSTADGDDLIGGLDDEDGLKFPSSFSWGAETAITILVSQTSGRLNVWIDWDGDDTWETGERIFDAVLAAGFHTIPITPPVDLYLTSNTVHAVRARITTSSSGTQAVDGFGGEGEVEDYVITVQGTPEGLTEIFDTGMTNLSFSSITFTPDSDSPLYYEMCSRDVSGYFKDPTGGMALDFSSTNEITIGPFREPVPVWNAGGTETFHTSVRVGRDGYIRFATSPEPEDFVTLDRHFDGLRLSALFSDLDGTVDRVSWKELSDRVVVTWDEATRTVVLFGTTVTTNSFQAELFFDGRLRISMLEIGNGDGIVGLSRDDDTPYPLTDLNALAACCGIVPDNSDISLVPGSAVITAGGSPNTAGDNFDLDTTGGGADMTLQCGFGDLGKLFLNVDATNLYIGATGVDPEGPNAMLIFLGLSSLTDNHTNLAAKTGGPGALDNLDNLSFGQPMDLALIVGDEFGDGNFTSFSIGGNDFGQGVFYLGGGASAPSAITGAQLSQFDGFGTSAVTNQNMDGDQQVNRWEASIPLSAINAPAGIADLGQVSVLGVVVGGNIGGDRYISGNYLGASAAGTLGGDNNYGFSSVTIEPLIFNSDGNRYVAPGGGHLFPFLTWAHAATNIQDAIDAASAGETIFVSNGVYNTGGRTATDSTTTNRVFVDKPLHLVGVNGPSVTIIEGKGPNGDAAIRGIWLTNGASLTGFTITNGATRTVGGLITHEMAGGIWAQSTSVIVSNCMITGNTADFSGGGSWQGTFYNSSFIANISTEGGGGPRNGILYNCLVKGNRATIFDGGGAAGGTLYNCLVVGNHAGRFGGASQNTRMINCTVVSNTAGDSVGGVYQNAATNSIIWGNTAPSNANHYSMSGSYNLTTPLLPGAGNVDSTPVFVNAAGGDFRLLSTSPGINAGNNADAPAGSDLDGNSRIAFGTVDMGAYELLALTVAAVVTNTSDGDAGSLRQAVIARPDGGFIYFDSSLSGQTLTLESQLVIDKDLTIDASGLGVAPILSGGNSNRVIFITNATVVLDTLTIADGTVTNTDSLNRGGGISARDANLTVRNSTIRNNAATFGGGVSVINGYSFFENVTIADNAALSAFPDGGGVLMDGTAIVHFVHSTIANNQATDEGGGIKVNGGQLILENTVVAGNGPSIEGSDIRFAVDQLIGTNFIGITSGATLPSGTVLTGNPLLGPLQDNGGPTWTLEPATNSPLLDAAGPSGIDRDQRGAPRPSGLPDIGAVEVFTNTTYFVAIDNPSPQWPYITWSTAATNIQDAIDAAAAGGNVVVSNGVYQTGGRTVPGSLLTNRVVIDKPITVESVNGPEVTLIMGESVSGDAAVRCVWMTNSSTLVGFTLTNGATRTSGDISTERSGGGVWAQSTNAVVSNCTLTENWASSDGGGSYGGTLNNCTLTGNSAAFGGGASFYLNPGTLNHCTLTGNSAIEGGGAWGGTLNNCTLTGNSANRGGGAWGSTLNNCTLTGNSANEGGGGASDSALNNCTLTGNSASFGGGASGSTLNNCIVYFNTAPSGANYALSTINDTCTTPMPGSGTGNITNAPMFVNAAGGDYRLALGSPCINRGNNAIAVGTTDLDGNPRIAFGTVDMGAYEYQTPALSGAVHYVVLDNPNAGFPYTTWDIAAAGIQDAIDAAVDGNTVLVSNGVYQTGGRTVAGSLLTNRVVIDKPITVESVNGAEVTIIRGKQPKSDAAVRCVWMTNGATLVGFTLTNGATRVDFSASEGSGGGAVGGTLRDSRVTGNAAEFQGGGVYQVVVINSVLSGNSAEYGGGAQSSTLNNSLLVGNTGWFAGGGARFSTLNNCTVVGNTVGAFGFAGGGVEGSTLNNSIVFDNTAPDGANYFAGSINFSCTTPLPPGPGNVTNDPMFVDAANSNFTLMASSPARDSGNNALAPSGPDLAGNPRIVHGYVDMGAFEFQGGTGQGDFDGDGDGNGDERVAGTDFMDPNDVFRTSGVMGGGVLIDSVAGRLYAVDYNDDLSAEPQVWTEFTNNIAGTDGPITIHDPDDATNRNYRVRVELAP